MTTSRMESFSDCVLSIVITVMLLQLPIPHGEHLSALRPILPGLLGYLLSFIYIGIYWTNHHHIIQVTPRVTGAILWANLHLLFWLSLVPLVTGWIDDSYRAAAPTALYGVVLLGSGFAFYILQLAIIRAVGADSTPGRVLRPNWKGNLSLGLYLLAVGVAFVSVLVADLMYCTVAAMWLIPDRRLESTPAEEASS